MAGTVGGYYSPGVVVVYWFADGDCVRAPLFSGQTCLPAFLLVWWPCRCVLVMLTDVACGLPRATYPFPPSAFSRRAIITP